MDGSKLDVDMVFSLAHGDFGIRNVCCFGFGEYCLPQSSTLLKSYNTFIHLNTRAGFWKASKLGCYYVGVFASTLKSLVQDD